MQVEALAPLALDDADLRAQTERLLRADRQRMACLQAAAELALPDWALGAGFIRNLIWDHLHGKAVPTPLNDIDLIYLDPLDPQGLAESEHEQWLTARLPGQRWEVRNQARMHQRQRVSPFASSLEALSHWVEHRGQAAARRGVRVAGPLRFCPQLVPAGECQSALSSGEPGVCAAHPGKTLAEHLA